MITIIGGQLTLYRRKEREGGGSVINTYIYAEYFATLEGGWLKFFMKKIFALWRY